MPAFENLFERFFNDDLMYRDYAGFVPSVNISENDKAYSIEVNAPGFQKNDFNIKVKDRSLTIEGSHSKEKNEEKDNYVRKEFNYGSFSRSFELSDVIDEDKIDAKYDNGILRIILPKNEKGILKNTRVIKVS